MMLGTKLKLFVMKSNHTTNADQLVVSKPDTAPLLVENTAKCVASTCG